MANKIQITTMGQVFPDELITGPDDDYPDFSAASQSKVNEDYDVERLTWYRVETIGGFADIGKVTLVDPDGEPRTHEAVSWDATVWRLVDENWIPVRVEV